MAARNSESYTGDTSSTGRFLATDNYLYRTNGVLSGPFSSAQAE
ncbi:hypothetical protein [Pantoea sp. LMR881]|nr:hypothetical protein [Pantoea sp. LMR881]